MIYQVKVRLNRADIAGMDTVQIWDIEADSPSHAEELAADRDMPRGMTAYRLDRVLNVAEPRH